MRINYLLIDLENVKPENLGLVSGGRFKVKVFVGANQKNVPLTMAQALQSFGPDAEYIRIESHGKNALDRGHSPGAGDEFEVAAGAGGGADRLPEAAAGGPASNRQDTRQLDPDTVRGPDGGR